MHPLIEIAEKNSKHFVQKILIIYAAASFFSLHLMLSLYNQNYTNATLALIVLIFGIYKGVPLFRYLGRDFMGNYIYVGVFAAGIIAVLMAKLIGGGWIYLVTCGLIFYGYYWCAKKLSNKLLNLGIEL